MVTIDEGCTDLILNTLIGAYLLTFDHGMMKCFIWIDMRIFFFCLSTSSGSILCDDLFGVTSYSYSSNSYAKINRRSFYFFFAIFIGSIFFSLLVILIILFLVLSVAGGGGCHGTNYYKLLAGVVIFLFWFHSIISLKLLSNSNDNYRS